MNVAQQGTVYRLAVFDGDGIGPEIVPNKDA